LTLQFGAATSKALGRSSTGKDAIIPAISGMRATAASKTSSELDAMTPPHNNASR